MSSNPAVSVVIPTYNGAKYIEATLESVLNQTFQDFEIIVVDDASTDPTPLLIEQVAHSNSKIRLLRQPNAGAQAARNNGIRHSTGSLIAMLDQDDRWLPTFLEQLVPCLENYHIVIADLQIINDEGRITNPWKRARLVSLSLPYILIISGIVSPSGMLFRRYFWQEIGPFEETLPVMGDVDWLIRAALSGGRAALVSRPVWQYRVHSSNTSHNIAAMVDEAGRILDLTYQRPNLPRHVLNYKSYAYLIHNVTAAAKFYARHDSATARHFLGQAYQGSPSDFFSLQTFISFLKVFVQITGEDLDQSAKDLILFVNDTTSTGRERARLTALGYFALSLLSGKGRPAMALRYLGRAVRTWPGFVLEPGIYRTAANYLRIYGLEFIYRLKFRQPTRSAATAVSTSTKLFSR